MRPHLCLSLGILLSIAFSTKSFAFPGYIWTISHSAADPLVFTGSPNNGVDTLFLWFYCSLEGMSAAEMELASLPPGQVLAFIPVNGYLNAGDATHLLLAVGGCPFAPVVAGNILILHLAPLALCLEGANVTVDCSADPQAWPHDRHGYADFGLPLCLSDTSVHCGVSVEERGWGSIKSLYR